MAVLEGKAAVVTGGSRGIGRAIVERLAGDGTAVVFTYARNAEAATAVERAVRAAGGQAHAVQIDLAKPGAVEQLTATANDHLDGLDILVNNAALDTPPRPIAETEDHVWDQTMTVNARSAFLTTRHAARTMRDNGRIINISTLNTVRPAPGIAAYAASKGAIEQLTKVAATELGGRGITVNAVCPGATDTDLLRHTNPESVLAQIPALTPLGRLGQPADIADVVAMLASPDGRWLTGQIIFATGGMT
ncbi:MAG: SDR family oxidoreductase [Sciscionella sp.]